MNHNILVEHSMTLTETTSFPFLLKRKPPSFRRVLII